MHAPCYPRRAGDAVADVDRLWHHDGFVTPMYELHARHLLTSYTNVIGYASDLAFYSVPDTPTITGLNWRLMMASAMFPAVIVCCFVFLCPESPRWYMSKGRHAAAYEAMCTLRFNKIQAARDVFYMAELLKAEENMKIGQSKIKELWAVPRNRRAMLASEIVMFMQQVCISHSAHTSFHTDFTSSAAST
jgi:hypothetical protein